MSELSPSEKKGILIVSAIILIGFVIQFLQPHFVNKDLYDYSVQDSIFRALSQDSTKAVKDSAYSNSPNAQSKSPKPGSAQKHKAELPPASININTASQKDLEKLPRIGPVTAQNILKYREANGPFKNYDDIQKVKRIGPKTIELIKPYIIFSDSK